MAYSAATVAGGSYLLSTGTVTINSYPGSTTNSSFPANYNGLLGIVANQLSKYAQNFPALIGPAVGLGVIAEQNAEAQIQSDRDNGVQNVGLVLRDSINVVNTNLNLAFLGAVATGDLPVAAPLLAVRTFLSGASFVAALVGQDPTAEKILAGVEAEVSNAIPQIVAAAPTVVQPAVAALGETVTDGFSVVNDLVTMSQAAAKDITQLITGDAAEQQNVSNVASYEHVQPDNVSETLTANSNTIALSGNLSQTSGTVTTVQDADGGISATSTLNLPNSTSQQTTVNASGASTTTSFSGLNETGKEIAIDQENSDDTSTLTTFAADGSSTAVTYTGPQGTGTPASSDKENSNGTSSITSYVPNGSATIAYSGPKGTGTAGPVTLTTGTGNQQTVVTLGSSSFVFPATRVPYQGSSAYQYGGIAVQVQSGQAIIDPSDLVGLFSDAQVPAPSNQFPFFGPGTYQTGAPGSLVVGETGSTASGVFQSYVPIEVNGTVVYQMPVGGAIYGEPSATVPSEINFGNLHVGQTSTVKVTVGNAASGALEDTMNVGAFSFLVSSGGLSLQSGTLAGIAAGSSGTVSLTATALKAIYSPLDVLQSTITSHDSVLPDAPLPVPVVIHADSNIMNYATPAFMVQVGVSPLQTVTNGGTFDLGTVTQGSFASGLNLYISNTAPSLQSDVIDGSYTASGSGFSVVGLTSGSFSGVGGGGLISSLLALSPITSTLGKVTETVTIHTTSDDSFSSTPLPDQTITITANVVAGTSSSGGASSGGTGSTGGGATGSGGTTGGGATSGGSSTGTGTTSSGSGSTGGSSTGTGTGTSGSGTTGGASSGTGTGTTGGGSGTSTGGVTTSGSSVTVTGSGNNVTLASGGTATTGAGGNTVTLAGAGTVISNGPDTIKGGPGADTVQLLGTGATVVGGTGALAVTGGPGSNTIFAGPGGLTYTGGSGSDTIVAGKNPTNVTGGGGGGLFFGGGASTISAGAGGALNVEVGSAGDQLYATGPSGVLFGTTGGDILMSSAADSGTSVFFGANGSGKMTFITGSGNDLLALGQGTNTVTLGSGHDVIFANGGTTSTTTINAGSGSLDLAFSGATTVLDITAGAARAFGLYAYAPGPDTIHLQGYSSTQAATAIANQKSVAGGTQLSLSDGSVISLVGVSHVTTSLFS